MSRRAEDPFGFKKLSRRMTLASNRMTARMTENSFEMTQRMLGYDVRKTHKGRDFEVQRRDVFGRKIGKPISVEVKSGGSQLTEAQRRRRARLGRRYKVVRY